MKKLFIIFVIFSVAVFAQVPKEIKDKSYFVRLEAIDFEKDINFIANQGYDIAFVDKKNKTFDIIVNGNELKTLLKRYYKVLKCIETNPLKEEINKDIPGYKTPEQEKEFLVELNNKYPNITKLFSVGKSIEGRDIWCLKISDNPDIDEDEPVVFFVGAHHCRELMSIEAVNDIIEQLLKNYETQEKTKSWINNIEIFCMPLANPDGVNRVFEVDKWWRKNCRKIDGTVRGVDLNRNYGFKWGANNSGSSSSPTSNTYRGEAPFSEPEAKYISEFARSVVPSITVSFHSYGEVVLFPYGCEVCKNPEGYVAQDIAKEFAGSLIKDSGSGNYGYRGQLYPVNGLDRDWHFHDLGTISFVVELSNRSQGFIPDYYDWRDKTVEGIRPGWQYLLNRVTGSAINFSIKDSVSKSPIPAKIEIQEIIYNENEERKANSNGKYIWLVKPGTYNVKVTYQDYQTQEKQIQVNQSTVEAEFDLKKTK